MLEYCIDEETKMLDIKQFGQLNYSIKNKISIAVKTVILFKQKQSRQIQQEILEKTCNKLKKRTEDE